MNAQQVIDKILGEAQKEAAQIRDEAQARAAADQDRLQSDLEQFRQETQTQAARAAEDRINRILARARMDNRKAYLAAKVQLLDEVFEAARRKVNSLPDQEYQELMKGFMVKAVQTGDEKILVGRDEKRIDDRVLRDVNRQLGPGYKGNLQFASERADIDGGFILQRGSIRSNASTEVLIDQVRDKLEIELAEQLFGGEEEQNNQ